MNDAPLPNLEPALRLLSAWEAVRSGLAEIFAHPLRSTLTLAGIIMGSAALVVLISLLGGVRDMVGQIFADIGFQGVLEIIERPPESNLDRQLFQRAPPLTLDDAQRIRQRAEGISAIAPVTMRPATVRIQGKQLNLRIRGTNPDYLEIRDRQLLTGRNINDLDLHYALPVALISDEIASQYFGTHRAVGSEITILNDRFTIIGVIKRPESTFGDGGAVDFFGERSVITIPITTYRTLIDSRRKLDKLTIKAQSPNSMDRAIASSFRILEVAHRGVRNFQLSEIGVEIAEAEASMDQQFRTWNIILGALASVSLLVGGIGILSVMLIVIHERLFEIGLRKAIGATNLEIFIQFLIESLVLAAFGALVGASAGATLVIAIASKFPFHLAPSSFSILLAISFALLTGLIFGWYPAHKAGNMAPVDALRR